ncbi:hypothetical protein [Arthrobacter sp. G119Y2]|uniref:hypothetical protein n=1 Tax=Arthrobacter sp. G119Y2 TaxID=3134965 RepID=UPI0031193382
MWRAYEILIAPSQDADGKRVLLHFFGLSKDQICGWIILLSFLGGTVGLALLAYGLIGRIRKSRLRQTVGWITYAGAALASPLVVLVSILIFLIAAGIEDQTRFEAATGQSVVVTQDAFDGDVVDIYTEHGGFHYVWNRSADELAGFPRVKDRNCELAAADKVLLLSCGAETVTVVP